MSWRTASWASLAPFGLGRQKPGHFRSMARVAWDNRGELPFAYRILRDGVCDGCALGTTGLRDWTLDGVHLCMVRLELLRLNTMPALDRSRLADCGALERLESRALRKLGRLAHPMRRRRGERGFTPISWGEALDQAVAVLRETDPRRAAFYLTSRGIPNETYYAAQKAARFYGSPHVDNAARLCHAASTTAMKRALGHGASTGSYTDWIGADLIVFFGSNVPNNQPVTTKYLYYAKQRGTKIAVVNPYREPGLERYWVPSVAESALFGTRLADSWFEVDTGGDLGFLNGAAKALLALPGGVDREFVASATEGFEALRRELEAQSWEELEAASGATRAVMLDFARLLLGHPNTILVWSMGLTQHRHGVDTVQALCNLGLLRGLPGRPRRGLTPIRGHSGVQGGAEVGCVPTLDVETRALYREVWGFEPPPGPGLSASEQVEAAARGEIDVFWMVGGNFLETLAGEGTSREAMRRPRLRVHQDIVLSSAMLVEPVDTVLVLPAATRYETPGGVTETTTERRIVFSPEIPGRRIGEARPEWEVLCDVMRRVRPDRADAVRFAGTAAIRAEIARAVPLYAGIETLRAKGDQVQWGGPTLYADGRFATADGKAHLVPVRPPEGQRTVAAGELRLSTRRGKQFNSMVQASQDDLTGSAREDVLMAAEDAERRGLGAGSWVRLSSPAGVLRGRVRIAPIKPGNVEVHWPEGGVLLDAHRIDPQSMEPDYNARVRVELAGGGAEESDRRTPDGDRLSPQEGDGARARETVPEVAHGR
ncbi:MAG TPA: FdhF/YdeP family oxidoreductase [Thermoanaerobaculia bacterium]|nr:FdhF/YdeP family oxidoreductase [Thermoanaerobaculia bacterium]